MPNHIRVIKYVTSFISELFKYSVSGHEDKIKREGLDDYKKPHDSVFKEISGFFNQHKYIDGFNTMLQNDTGDCGEQSLILAMILMRIPSIKENFKIFFTSLIGQEKRHTFLTLSPRNQKAFDKIDLIKPVNGALLLKNRVITADPWRCMTIEQIPNIRNPLDYLSNIVFEHAEFYMEDFDSHFLALQKDFLQYTHNKLNLTELLAEAERLKNLPPISQDQTYAIAYFSTGKTTKKEENISDTEIYDFITSLRK